MLFLDLIPCSMIKPQTSNLHRGQTLTCLFKSTWSLCQTPQFPSPKASVWGEVRDRGHTSHFSFQHGAQWIHSLRWNCQRGALFELSGASEEEHSAEVMWIMVHVSQPSPVSSEHTQNAEVSGPLTSFASLHFHPFHENDNQVAGPLLWHTGGDPMNIAEA